MPRRALASLAAVSVVLATAVVGSTSATAAPPTSDLADQVLASAELSVEGSAPVADALAEASGTVTAFVQLDTPAGVDVADDGGDAADVLAAAEETTAVAQDVVPQELTSANARSAAPKRIATTTNLVSGALVVGDAAQIRALAEQDGVVAVRRVAERTIDNAAQDEFTRALATWQDTGILGEDVTVGIIDTGLDYTHADFGGPGTTEAYEAAYGENGTGPVPADAFDPDKYVGGYDFAGTTYDAGGEGAELVPVPDENPIDVNGHGTHVAGTTAGFGVTEDGETFRGDYSELESVLDWPIGPGVAPLAKLYALKVFGDVAGSTGLTGLALDHAADPNGDGDFSDRLDVLNLSLGASGSPADDPESLQIQELTDLGTIVVLSAGNEGDVEDIGGSPGNGPAGLTVAASVGANIAFDAVEVTEASDADLVGLQAAQNSISYAGTADVTAPVAYVGATFDGCTAFTADQAATVAGKIAYLWWDDDDASRRCGSGARFNNAAAAGAVGVLLPTENTIFASGIAGNATIPGAQMTAATTDALLPEIEAGTLSVKIGPSLAIATRQDVAPDTLASFSSRGAHGSLGWAKPDVAAPGQQIVSANVGSGTGGQSNNGTSMASPHVAGVAALVRAAHPGWSSSQVKAAIVNTATHDVTTEPGGDLAYGPQRVGSGRVDTLAAVTTDTLVYNSASPVQTSVSFGVVPLADEPVTVRKTVTVQNTGSTTRTYRTSVTTSTTAGGATITASPATLRVRAGGTGLVTLTFTADPATVARDMDPTQEATNSGVPRDYVSQVAGRLVLTSGDAEWRVPVQGTPRPTTDLEAAAPLTLGTDGTGTLALEGRDVVSDGWFGLVTPLVHAADSPKLEEIPGFETSASTLRAGDIRHVGWASTAPEVTAAGGDPKKTGTLAVGIATDGDWAALGLNLYPTAYVDVDGDGTPDVGAQAYKLADTDLSVFVTYDVETGDTIGGPYLLTPFAGNVETGVFDNSTVVLPVPLADLGVDPGTKVDVWAAMVSSYAFSGQTVDQVGPFTVDPYDPPVWFESNIGQETWSEAYDGATVAAHAGPGADEASVLLLHHLNPTAGERAQVVDVEATTPTATTTTLEVEAGKRAGEEVVLTATVTPADVAGTVTFLDGDTELGTAEVEGGTATLTTTKVGAGEHALTARFASAGSSAAASTSEAVTVTLAQSRSEADVELDPTKASYGSAVAATVTVEGATWAPEGAVELRKGSTVLATGELTVDGLVGTAQLELPRDLAVGRHALKAVYVGSADVKGSSATTAVRITPATTTVALTTESWRVDKGATPEVTVTVTGTDGGPAPTGKVKVLVGTKKVADVELTDGVGTLTLPKATSTTVVSALYQGKGGYLPSATTQTLRVR